jgi:hypothetical protein
MPPRLVTVAIVLFWLATLGWFFQHDLWPRFRPGGRPPYTLDLAQEVGGRDKRRWIVYHNHFKVGTALSWVWHHNADDTYELHSQFFFEEKGVLPGVRAGTVVGLLSASPGPGPLLAASTLIPGGPERGPGLTIKTVPITAAIKTMDSMSRVTRDGQLREVDAALDGRVEIRLLENGPMSFHLHVHGRVEDGLFAPQLEVESPMLGKRTVKSRPVAVAGNHSVFNPMQPWNRLLDLQENQTWQMERYDPLLDALTASLADWVPNLGQNLGTETLEAGVKQGTEMWSWNNKDVACLVIEYRSKAEGYTGRTYVRQADGLVLRQEATRGEDQLALERDPR